MKTLNKQIANTMSVTSAQSEPPKTGVMENVTKNLNGFVYTSEGTITAVKGTEQYTIDPLAFVALAAIKTEIKPHWLETGQLQDKVVLPAVGHKAFEFKTAPVHNIVIKGHYVTAAQYRANCIALQPARSIDLSQVLVVLDALTAKDSKEAILAGVHKAMAILEPAETALTEDQQANYDRLTELETPLWAAVTELEPLGLSEFSFVSDKAIRAKLDPTRLTDVLAFIPTKPEWKFNNEMTLAGVYLTIAIN